jgi:hypothetical protein
MKIMPGIFRRPVARVLMALVTALIVGTGTSLFLAWPNLMKKYYEVDVPPASITHQLLRPCLCAYGIIGGWQTVPPYKPGALYVEVCGLKISRVPLFQDGGPKNFSTAPDQADVIPHQNPTLEPGVITAAECSSDAMMAAYKYATLTGLSAAAAAFALMMFWIRARGQKAA